MDKPEFAAHCRNTSASFYEMSENEREMRNSKHGPGTLVVRDLVHSCKNDRQDVKPRPNAG